jgi:cytochrome c
MANELWIAAVLFGLSTSAALAQDVAAGERSFRKCLACHSIGVDTQNKIGPRLNGIDGRKCGSVLGKAIPKRTEIAHLPGTRLSFWTTSKIQN